VIVTLDAMLPGPVRAARAAGRRFPGAERSACMPPPNGAKARRAGGGQGRGRHGDIIIANLLFIEEHIRADPARCCRRGATLRRDGGVIADAQIVKLTRMGKLDMSQARKAMLQAAEEAARQASKPGKLDRARRR
jgi:magnesium chelatase subunit H